MASPERLSAGTVPLRPFLLGEGWMTDDCDKIDPAPFSETCDSSDALTVAVLLPVSISLVKRNCFMQFKKFCILFLGM
jgi:hypothetical protein